jgi:hypothetical protein
MLFGGYKEHEFLNLLNSRYRSRQCPFTGIDVDLLQDNISLEHQGIEWLLNYKEQFERKSKNRFQRRNFEKLPDELLHKITRLIIEEDDGDNIQTRVMYNLCKTVQKLHDENHPTTLSNPDFYTKVLHSDDE